MTFKALLIGCIFLTIPVLAQAQFTIDFRNRPDLHNVASGPLDPHYPGGTISCDPQPHCRLTWHPQTGIGVYYFEPGEGYEQGPYEIERLETLRLNFGGRVARFRQVWLSNLYLTAIYRERAYFAGDWWLLESRGIRTESPGLYVWSLGGYSTFNFIVYGWRIPPPNQTHSVSLMHLDMLN